MTSKAKRPAVRWTDVVDCALIVAIGLLGEAVHFSAQQGRAVISADAMQYIANAEALAHGDQPADFAMRKCGYSLFLMPLLRASGGETWAAVAANHVLLGLLPLGAYFWGRLLHSRGVGWAAALLAIARLQTVVWGNRVMSEPLFALLMTYGLLFVALGVMRGRSVVWLAPAGVLLGLAWLTRGTGVAVVGAAVLFILIAERTAFRRMVISLLALAAPVACCVVFECALNGLLAGAFRPTTGTAGAALLVRQTYHLGRALPDTVAGRRLADWVPERSSSEAYVVSDLDVWVARHRAVHDDRLSEWEYDRCMAQVARRMAAAAPLDNVQAGAAMFVHHLLRRGDGNRLSPVPHERRAEAIRHAREEGLAAKAPWFTCWGLPHVSVERSMALTERVEASAAQKAPFGDAGGWAALRYWLSRPIPDGVIRAAAALGRIWPIVALAAGVWLGLSRSVCLLVALVYLLDGLLISTVAITTDRFQFIWLSMDMALVAALLVVPAVAALRQGRRWVVDSAAAGSLVGGVSNRSHGTSPRMADHQGQRLNPGNS